VAPVAHPWLSAPWFEAEAGLASDAAGAAGAAGAVRAAGVVGRPVADGLTARLQFVVTGGPGGDVAYHRTFREGHLVASAAGVLDDAEVTFTTPWADAVQIDQGALGPAVAFMRGTTKAEGDQSVVLAALEATSGTDYVAFRRQVAAVTAY